MPIYIHAIAMMRYLISQLWTEQYININILIWDESDIMRQKQARKNIKWN